MCGICGIWGQSSPESLGSMVNAMNHRGPDDRGVFHDSIVSLGMTRLAIIDLSDAAHQPMMNRDGTVLIVYNGEVYNFQSERRELEAKGHIFSSQSDTEVVLKLYEHHGDDFLLRLRGMFALAIYDKRAGPGRERLLLARDHLGIKPLLVAHAGSRIVFASEVKALLASGLVERKIDVIALQQLLTYGSIYQPRTILQNVSMLLPAHRLIVDANGERVERYWSFGLDRFRGMRARPYDELAMEVASMLEQSVRLHMVSDVPVGAFLSGGVDSTFLVGLMAKAASHRIKTFSVGFEAEGASLDESDEAERTAQFLGTDHTRVVITGTDVRDRIQHIVRSLDQPSVDGVNSYFVSMAARRSVTVAISGTGGDEVFAGYPWFTQMALYEQQMRQKPWKATVTALLGNIVGHRAFDSLLSGRWAPELYNFLNRNDFLVHYANTYQIFSFFDAAHLLSPQLDSSARAGRLPVRDLQEIDELAAGTVVDRVSGLCLRGYTKNQLLRDIDAVSMAHSLEVRVPFLDVQLIDLALSLPMASKLGNADGVTNPAQATYRESGSKKILIDAGRRLGLLPADVDCQPKRGFSLPFDFWLKGPLREVLEDTLSTETINNRGFFQAEKIDRIKQVFFAGEVHWTRPWLISIIELWCRALLDSAAAE